MAKNTKLENLTSNQIILRSIRGKVGNITCGDEMLVAIQVKNDKIADIKWKTYGCASAIASTSMMSGVDRKPVPRRQP